MDKQKKTFTISGHLDLVGEDLYVNRSEWEQLLAEIPNLDQEFYRPHNEDMIVLLFQRRRFDNLGLIHWAFYEMEISYGTIDGFQVEKFTRKVTPSY